jgi:hypothetical protein
MNLVNALGMARHMSPFSRIHALIGIRTSMHFIFEPLDFIAKLASLVPKPKVNLGLMVCSSECRTIPTASTEL